MQDLLALDTNHRLAGVVKQCRGRCVQAQLRMALRGAARCTSAQQRTALHAAAEEGRLLDVQVGLPSLDLN